MESNYVLESIKEAIESGLKRKISEIHPKYEGQIEITYPQNCQYGDLSTSISYQLAYLITKDKKEAREKVNYIASKLIKELKSIPFILKIENVRGYINFFLDYKSFSKAVITNILRLRSLYGARERKNKKIIIEHTSANPIHPLHVGTARNSILGDSLARIYSFLGYEVETRFYINDMGKQVAYLVFVYSKIKDKVDISGKSDHWFGALYSIANASIESLIGLDEIDLQKNSLLKIISSKTDAQNYDELERYIKKLSKIGNYYTIDWIDILKKILEVIQEKKGIEEKNKYENVKQVTAIIDTINKTVEWLEVFSSVSIKWPKLSKTVLSTLINERNINEKISELMQKYESGEYKEINSLFREVCSKVLEGIKETLNNVGIKFDKFDWESDLVRNKLVDKILNELEQRGWIIEDKDGAKILNIKKALKIKDIRDIFGLDKVDEESAPPNLVLIRSDGTTLYTTRDIAYALYKGESDKVEKVLNIIGKDQTLPQKQLKAALYLAGYKNVADKLFHVAYELVILPGAKLSARRGRYITFDEILEDAKEKALEEIRKRSTDISLEEFDLARDIAVGAVKYALISVAPERTITFDWNRIINFEQNSGPFLQYTYARATSILRKINFEIPEADIINYEVLNTNVEKELIFNLARFPEIVLEAGEKFRPDIIADYANKISILFNSFYQRFPVLRADTREKRDARLIMVDAFRTVLRNSLDLLGIKPLEKM